MECTYVILVQFKKKSFISYYEMNMWIIIHRTNSKASLSPDLVLGFHGWSSVYNFSFWECIVIILFTVTFTQCLSVFLTAALLYCYTDSLTLHSNMFRPLIGHLRGSSYTTLFTQTAALSCYTCYVGSKWVTPYTYVKTESNTHTYLSVLSIHLLLVRLHLSCLVFTVVVCIPEM
jgi:hypothetical protein